MAHYIFQGQQKQRKKIQKNCAQPEVGGKKLLSSATTPPSPHKNIMSVVTHQLGNIIHHVE